MNGVYLDFSEAGRNRGNSSFSANGLAETRCVSVVSPIIHNALSSVKEQCSFTYPPDGDINLVIKEIKKIVRKGITSDKTELSNSSSKSGTFNGEKNNTSTMNCF